MPRAAGAAPQRIDPARSGVQSERHGPCSARLGSGCEEEFHEELDDGEAPGYAPGLRSPERRAPQARRAVARLELPLRRADLPARQPAAAQAARARAHQAAAARALGHDAGAELPLRAPEPGHQAARPGHDLRDRSGARRAGARRARLSRRDLQRGLPEHQPGRGGDEEAVQAVQLPGRHPQPRGAGDARVDPRRRRARLRAVARVRRGLRQSGPDRGVRRRRRRGRDGAARDGLARQQVPEPGARRLRAPDPAPERLQDREPLLPGAHPEGGAHEAARGLRLQALLRRGPRARGDAPADGRDARSGRRRDPARSGRTRASAASRSGRSGR